MKRRNILKAVAVAAALAALGATAYAQGKFNKYTLVSPDGIKFSDFKGYEDWAPMSTARTDKELKIIAGNPTIIKAFKSGVPGNGQPFPEGSRIVKMQWSLKKSTEAQFAVEVPDAPTQVFVMEKNSKRFPGTGGWGYAVFNHETATGKMTADAAKVDCGQSCHVTVKNKDYVFHPYQAR